MTTRTTCLSCVYITQSINIRAKPSCNCLPLININPNFQTKLLHTFCFTFDASNTSGTFACVSRVVKGRKAVGKIQTWVTQTGIHCRQNKMIHKLTLSMVCREFLNSNLDTMDKMSIYYGMTQITDCKFTPTLMVRNYSTMGNNNKLKHWKT